MKTIQVELSGGPHGGLIVEWKASAAGKIADHDEQVLVIEGKRYTYRYVPDPNPDRSPHAVYCGEAKD